MEKIPLDKSFCAAERNMRELLLVISAEAAALAVGSVGLQASEAVCVATLHHNWRHHQLQTDRAFELPTAQGFSQATVKKAPAKVCMRQGVLMNLWWVRDRWCMRRAASSCLIAEEVSDAATEGEASSSCSLSCSVSVSNSRVLSFFPIIDLL